MSRSLPFPRHIRSRAGPVPAVGSLVLQSRYHADSKTAIISKLLSAGKAAPSLAARLTRYLIWVSIEKRYRAFPEVCRLE